MTPNHRSGISDTICIQQKPFRYRRLKSEYAGRSKNTSWKMPDWKVCRGTFTINFALLVTIYYANGRSCY